MRWWKILRLWIMVCNLQYKKSTEERFQVVLSPTFLIYINACTLTYSFIHSVGHLVCLHENKNMKCISSFMTLHAYKFFYWNCTILFGIPSTSTLQTNLYSAQNSNKSTYIQKPGSRSFYWEYNIVIWRIRHTHLPYSFINHLEKSIWILNYNDNVTFPWSSTQ